MKVTKTVPLATQLDGGSGVDHLNLELTELKSSLNVDFSEETVQISLLQVSGFESFTFFSGSGDDSIVGSKFNDGFSGSAGNDTLRGMEGDDYVGGGDGNNVLAGGLGKDSLAGGSGTDQFVFDTAPVAREMDELIYFDHGVDKVVLDSAMFTGLTVGALSADAFVNGAKALDAEDRILFDTATDRILYDADGKGGVAAVAFAASYAFDESFFAADFLII